MKSRIALRMLSRFSRALFSGSLSAEVSRGLRHGLAAFHSLPFRVEKAKAGDGIEEVAFDGHVGRVIADAADFLARLQVFGGNLRRIAAPIFRQKGYKLDPTAAQ